MKTRLQIVASRLARIIGAYLAACTAAGVTAALVLIVLGNPRWDRDILGAIATIAAAVIMLAAVAASLPAAVIIAVAERRSKRAVGFYGVAGVAAAAFAWITLLVFLTAGRPPLLDAWLHLLQVHGRHILISCLSGLIGGLVYWHIAGRSAGNWRSAQAQD